MKNSRLWWRFWFVARVNVADIWMKCWREKFAFNYRRILLFYKTVPSGFIECQAHGCVTDPTPSRLNVLLCRLKDTLASDEYTQYKSILLVKKSQLYKNKCTLDGQGTDLRQSLRVWTRPCLSRVISVRTQRKVIVGSGQIVDDGIRQRWHGMTVSFLLCSGIVKFVIRRVSMLL